MYLLLFDTLLCIILFIKFQSPQWGSNSKGDAKLTPENAIKGFSPRNGEVILKGLMEYSYEFEEVSVPAMGK